MCTPVVRSTRTRQTLPLSVPTQPGERKLMPDITKHQLALDLVNENRLIDAAKLLAEALGEAEGADLWNDWATIQLALDEAKEAHAGYERALELEPNNAQVQFNLGVLLLGQSEARRGVDLLRQCA